MLIDRSHLSWAVFSGISLIAGTVGYMTYAWNSPNGPSGGSAMGLLFGIIGTLMMLFAGLLAARKPLRIRRIGSAQFWLKGHLWLGTLCIPFILFHAGFGWGGLLEQLMWYSLAIVAISGFFGLAVHQFLPRLLSNRTPLETFESQTPYQCDRMTFIADLRISALCESPLAVPPDHLKSHFVRLIASYNLIVNGPDARSEQNSKKLLLLQQVAPADVRDFFWAMAKYAKSEAKAIRFEGDFPELLEKTYAGLKVVNAVTSPEVAKEANRHSGPIAEPEKTKPTATTTAAKAPAIASAARTISQSEFEKKNSASEATAAVPKLSPIEMMKKKAKEKASAEAKETVSDTSAPVANAVPAADTPKLSPIEMMRKKSADKAAAGAEAVARKIQNAATADVVTPAVVSPTEGSAADTPKLSPIEIMRKKAAEKAAAAAAGGSEIQIPATTDVTTPAAVVLTEAPVADTPKLSPIEMMRKKATEKAAALAAAGGGEIQNAATADVATPAPVVPTEASVTDPLKLSPIEMMQKKAAEKLKTATEAAASQAGTAGETPASAETPATKSATESPAAEGPKLSPLEMMKKKAAEKAATVAAAENPSAEVKPENSPKRSPLDMLKKNSHGPPSTPASQPTGAHASPPDVSSRMSAVVVPPVPAKRSAAVPDRPAQPTAMEKQLLRDVYLEHVRPFLVEFRSRRSIQKSPLASAVEARRLFYEKESNLPAILHPVLNELSGFCEIRRQIELQRQILRWMHWWLMIHVPAAAVLLIFLLAHIVMALRVIPFSG